MKPPATHECPQKNSAQTVQPVARLYAACKYTNVLFYYKLTKFGNWTFS